jgi:acyl dehydratase/NAD(P)-dependent dehydrogenase (short-subunit alcohol dehydrogenase family)
MPGLEASKAATFTGDFAVTLSDSAKFARLSGDYNPLHVDPVAARRLRFGGTVAHGIHLILGALDAVAAQGAFAGRDPEALSATFDSPVPNGALVNLKAELEGNKLRVSASTAGQRAFTGAVELRASGSQQSAPHDAEFVQVDPQSVDFPPARSSGSVPVQLSATLLADLFPSLARMADCRWIADLLATTHVVGMHCPGLHSIYSSFHLRRSRHGAAVATAQYRVAGMEHRFQLLKLNFTGACLEGTVETFFRPRPVAQPSMKEVAELVDPRAFSGHRVLVVGGTRGLGELTAKVAAAGGAAVTTTYVRGTDDAARVCAEIQSLGGICMTRYLDVAQLNDSPQASDWLQLAGFTHVYFFASPFIIRNPGRWNADLFARFTGVYVSSFAALVERLLERSRTDRPDFFYPSSIFVTQPQNGFAEYSAAKCAGESLCADLRQRHRLRIVVPRLPRMRTDQTSALTDIGALDPLPVMLEMIGTFHGMDDAQRVSAFRTSSTQSPTPSGIASSLKS